MVTQLIRIDKVTPDLDSFELVGNVAKGMENMRLGTSGSDTDRALSLLMGHSEVTDFPDQDLVAVGEYQEETKGFWYLAVYSFAGDHRIIRVRKDDVVETVIIDPILNFKQDKYPDRKDYDKYYNVNIQVTPEQLRFWVDDTNPDRMINADKAASGGYFTPLS